MKPFRAIGSTLIVLLLFSQNGSTTILTSTLIMGFMGGFLMGKITLGTFLTVMSQINGQGTPILTLPASLTGTTTAKTVVPTTPVKSTTRFDESAFVANMNIPNSVDNEVRDQFLRQLGKMDPLNCLPKVFCEISSDPNAASNLFGAESVFPFASSPKLQKDKIKPVKANKFAIKIRKSHKPKPTKSDDEYQDEQENDDDTSDSRSEEEEVETGPDVDPEDEAQLAEDDEEALMAQYEKRVADAIEAKALDEMIDEYDDPINYYFILKDKKKTIHPDLYGAIKNADSRRSLGPSSASSYFSDRLGDAPDYSIESPAIQRNKRPTRRRSSATSAVDDIFADDPFFDDFSRSLKFDSADDTKQRVAHVGQLRRSKREAMDEDGIIIQYRLAAKVAENFKDPAKCRTVFNTCPYDADEVMTMINQMNTQEPKTKKKKNPSMKNLKNTLLAIEKLNNATMQAKSTGASVDYGKIMDDALRSQAASSSATSTKIIEEFEEFTDQIQNENDKAKSNLKNLKKPKPILTKRSSHLKKKQSVRQRTRRQAESVELSLNPSTLPNVDKPTVNVQPMEGKVEIRESEDNTSVPIDPKTDIIEKEETVTHTAFELPHDTGKDAESRIYKSEEIEEDDEASPVGSETPSKIPTFSQTYFDTLQSPSKTKGRPRPVYPLVKVKPYLKRTTTPPSDLPTTTVRSRRPVPQITQKFSGEVEDDEEEAKNSEDAIEVLLSKYKTKDKKSKP